MSQTPHTPDNLTDVSEFIADLDGGHFERMLAVALSQSAAAAIDHNPRGKAKSKVTLDFTIEQIAGTQQVRMSHRLIFKKPTSTGRSTDEAEGHTVWHVGKGGKLSLAQPSLLDKESRSKQTRIQD